MKLNPSARGVRRYLVPPARSFWRWQDDGGSIGLPNGATIAFREEIEAAARRLAPRGLPPLGTIVLMLAACRESWPKWAPRVASSIADAAHSSQDPWPAYTPEVMNKLSQLHDAFRSLKRRPGLAAQVCGAIFEHSDVTADPPLAAAVVRTLSDRHQLERVVATSPLHGAARRLEVELLAAHFALRQFDFASLEQRLETGLDRDVLPALIPEIEAGAVRRLLDSLKSDSHLAGFARLSLELTAATALPRRPIDDNSLSAGGFSDIDQRGTLDRLLVSELAYDDFTLAVRVAANEALYLRREAPPRAPHSRRAILVDAGVRLWGLPRVFAAAVAVALAASAAPGQTAVLFRPRGVDVERMHLASAEDARKLLAVLNPEHHPGRCLAAFLKAAHEVDPTAELAIVIGEDVLADADFRRALAPLADANPYVATVNREGRFQLLRWTSLGVQKLGGATLSLDALLAPSRDGQPPRTPLEDPRRRASLPAIFRVHPFPLRLPHAADFLRSWWVEEGVGLSATPDRRLLLWDDKHLGARQLSDSLPEGKVLWTQRTATDGIAVAVLGELSRAKLHLLRAGIRDHWCESCAMPFRSGAMRGVCEHRGVLFAIYDERIEGVSFDGLRPLRQLELSSSRQWLGSRYFREHDRLHALTRDGGSVAWEPVPANESISLEATAIFENREADGVIVVTSGGETVPLPPSEVYVDAAGAATSARERRPDSAAVRATATRDRSGMTPVAPADFMRDAIRAAVEYSKKRLPKLTSAFIEGGYVWVVDETRQCWTIIADSESLAIRRAGVGAAPPARRTLTQEFAPWQGADQFGFSLSVAAWQDGSRAVYDSRGLLHLTSSDTAIAEVSLVLIEGPTAAWSSRHGVFGLTYFTGDDQVRWAPADLAAAFRAFIARLR